MFHPQQSVAADPTDPHSNQIQFDYRNGMGMFLQGGASHAPRGSLAMQILSGVPMNRARLGIGMSNAAAIVVQALPNMMLVHTPRPTYWITAGAFGRGQVLDAEPIATQAAQVPFDGTFAMRAVLGPNNLWTVSRG
jgi:rhizosphere induced protein